MIVAERKPFDEILKLVAPYQRILLVGCGTCVAVCMAGGEKEVEILATELRMRAEMEGRSLHVDEITLTRQCDAEYLDQIEKVARNYDAIVSLACGAGVQHLAGHYDTQVILPALNTRFIGVAKGAGQWDERCRACSDCHLGETGGICPVTLCAKGLLNGPCGGTNHGKCEVNDEQDCAWTLIYRRLDATGRLDFMKAIRAPRDHQKSASPAKYTHTAYEQSGAKDE